MLLYQDNNYRVEFSSEKAILHFSWEDGHKNMSYDDFKEACCNYLGYGFEYQAKNFVIDVRNFQLNLPPDFPDWQKNEHYPRYYKLGVEKVAYLMPEAYIPNAKEIEKEDGKFELKNFANSELALNWI
ncbi:MAG: hypothetical protein MRZ79_19535 [Bacteroidia bacterium]|nr:hypothetical protein [Bacteroidia bacterium]